MPKPKKVLIFEENEFLFDWWMLETQIALGQYEDDDYLHARTVDAGLQLLQANTTDITAVVIGIVNKDDDWEYSKGQLIRDVKDFLPSAHIIIASDLQKEEFYRTAEEVVYTNLGATHICQRDGVSAILEQVMK